MTALPPRMRVFLYSCEWYNVTAQLTHLFFPRYMPLCRVMDNNHQERLSILRFNIKTCLMDDITKSKENKHQPTKELFTAIIHKKQQKRQNSTSSPRDEHHSAR